MTTAETQISTGTGGAQEGSGARGKTNIEVLIIAFNEEINLPHALKSVCGWADKVFVVDSESTDRTREIAGAMGADVVVQPWLGYARQKNWALENLPFESEWVFILDSDEWITDELKEELEQIARRPAHEVSEDGFYVNRLTYFLNKPIKHCGYFPSYNLRFFKRGQAVYEDREVHEHMIVQGETRRLKELMVHWDRRGLEHFIAKHNRYSTLEARELFRDQHEDRAEQIDQLDRGVALRRWLKYHVLPKLPLPGFFRFIYMYILRVGFLDGITGLRFCLFLASYDSFIALKLAELRAAEKEGLSPVAASPVEAKNALARPEGSVLVSDSAKEPKQPREVFESKPERKRVHKPITRGTDLGLRRPWQAHDKLETGAPPVSVIVLTYNEETNIRACLESCSWCDDVHVLDSGSKDRTCEIAEEMGARVWTNPFESFGQQRNWAIDNIEVKHRWQFQLDADEQFTVAGVQELAETISSEGAPGGVVCYHCPSMMMFMGRWLRRAAEYPVYQVRLIDKERCRYEDYGHGQREVPDGPSGTLDEPYLHYNFSKGLDEWFDKHNRYSTLEASQALEHVQAGTLELMKGVVLGGRVGRRRSLKRLSYKIPARASLIQLYQMVFRFGFLDGVAGWNYTRMRATYENMISVKMSVMKHSPEDAETGGANRE